MDLKTPFSEVNKLHTAGSYKEGNEAFASLCRETVSEKPTSFSHLVHYTRIDTLLNMLRIKPDSTMIISQNSADYPPSPGPDHSGFLRMYDTVYSNDPGEGYFFVNAVDENHSFRDAYNGVWKLFERRSQYPAYFASLVSVKEWEDADDLVFWRTYGENGTGCALLFPQDRFDDVEQLYSVQYGEKTVTDCLDKLQQLFEYYATMEGAVDLKSISSPEHLSKEIISTLSPLVYLYKSDAYDFENETRVILPYSDLAPSPLNCEFIGLKGLTPRWRHFVELPQLACEKLLMSDAKIILGPAVSRSENIKFVLQQVLPHLGYHGPEVLTSKISYRA